MSKIEVNTIEPQCGTNLTLGANNDTVSLGTGAAFTGGIGAVKWETTPQTGSFAAAAGRGYFMNTTSGALTVTLPAGSAGAIVAVADYAATFQNNALTISPNGTDKIGGVNADVVLNTEGQSATFLFVDSTQGWINVQDSTSNIRASSYVTATGGTQTECGDFKIHTFTGPGTFCVSNAGTPGGSTTVEYLVVAGGGAGGGCSGGGSGGGAGGFRFASPTIAPLTYPAKPLAGPAALPVSVQGYPIQVGAGASNPGGSGSAGPGVAGTPSIFSTITSAGGGSAQSPTTPGFPTSGDSGGSGAGSQSSNGSVTQDAGAGNTPPVSPSQGNPGGRHNPYPASCGGAPAINGGGGGGAMAAGGQNPEIGGIGGGLPTAFGANGQPCGSFRYYAGGGGGICRGGSAGQAGGKGGGGTASGSACGGGAGTANTGGGAAGARGSNTGPLNGGSGIVVIRYKFQN
jgi:hypothetical protein